MYRNAVIDFQQYDHIQLHTCIQQQIHQDMCKKIIMPRYGYKDTQNSILRNINYTAH